MMMDIKLNGETHPLPGPQSVAELVASLNLSNAAIAVAVNREVVARSDWLTVLLQANDQVDVVHAIGGG